MLDRDVLASRGDEVHPSRKLLSSVSPKSFAPMRAALRWSA